MSDLRGNDLNVPDNGRVAGAKPVVAYLVNQYPKVSHTFIRREILALERQGFDIRRFAIRGWDADVVDPADIDEGRRTRHVLKNGLLPLARAVLVNAIKRPMPTFRALRAALAMSRTSIRAMPYHIVWFAHACQLRLWFEADPVDHLHAHFGTNSTDVAHLLHLLGGPSYSFTVHGADEFDNVRSTSLPRKCSKAAFVVAISHFTKSQLMRPLSQTEWEKIQIVHCGLEEAFFAPTITPAPQQPVLLCIGRYCAEKSQLTLLDALAALARPEVRLVLAGDGDFRPLIERRIVELGLSRQVTLTGWIGSDEVRRLIVEATLIVQPSLMEGLPVVIMEAMAQGRPVISTYIAGIPELVQEGRTGWLVPAGDAAGLTEAIATALDTPADARAAMGRDGAVRVRERHHIDTEAGKLARLFTKGPKG